MRRGLQRIALVLAIGMVAPLFAATASRGAAAGPAKSYIVVFDGTSVAGGRTALGGDWAANHSKALSAVKAAGGTVTSDLSYEIAVMIVRSTNANFPSQVSTARLVAGVVAGDDVLGAVPTAGLTTVRTEGASVAGGGGPDDTTDPLESQQWSMQMIRAPQAHAVQAGWKKVDVGILDTGIDATHIDFDLDGVPGGATNIDCARGRDSVQFGPGTGTPDPCQDHQFHGTHVAGIVAAQANGAGVVGVAPNVTLVPIKTCDTPEGYCYAAAVVDAITYAGRIKLDVINMSFFTDDNEAGSSTQFKCKDDPEQYQIRVAVERAIAYAIGRGVVPIAAAGNSDTDLANKPAPYDGNCRTVPAEAPGTIAVSSLGPDSEKAGYSSYGAGSIDVAAPGGNGTTGDCLNVVLSTFPGNSYGCIQGTSMASPHAAGVAALIVSQFGTLKGADVVLAPSVVEKMLEATTIDIGLRGYDECFGVGRIDALRAVKNTTTKSYDATAPNCPEYTE
jgi:subtilisin family serine protease